MLAVGMHLGPVLHSSVGIPLLYILAAISYLSPVTGFFFISCCQFLPFPEGSPHNPAQIGVLVWIPMALLRYHRLSLNGASRLWPVLPWLIWLAILTGEQIYLPNSEYSKALIYSLIACQLGNESNGGLLKCLFGLCLGAICVMIAYWASQLGLPVEMSDWGGDREGFARLGSVRADAVMVWPALLLGISGLIGVQIAFASRKSPFQSPKWLTYLTLFLCIASLPPLVSTMSHGAYAGFVLIIIAVIWAGTIVRGEGAYGNARFRLLLKWGGIGVSVVVALFIFNAFELRTKVSKLGDYYKDASAAQGVAASRTGVW